MSSSPSPSPSRKRELVFLILQFLDEENFGDTAHRLEQESRLFFNMRYFEKLVMNGEWDEVEKYLAAFTKFGDNKHSTKIFFEIRKQKYLEALDKRDHSKAVEILHKDLKAILVSNEDLYKEMTQLLGLDNFRENQELSSYEDAKYGRRKLFAEIKKITERNDLICEKLNFPNFNKSRMWTLTNQSLKWQHHVCKNPSPNLDTETLFKDHICHESCYQSQLNCLKAPPHTCNLPRSSQPNLAQLQPSHVDGISAVEVQPTCLRAPSSISNLPKSSQRNLADLHSLGIGSVTTIEVQPNCPKAPSSLSNTPKSSLLNLARLHTFGTDDPSWLALAPPPPPCTTLAGQVADPSQVTRPSATDGSVGLSPPINTASSKQQRTPSNQPAIDNQEAVGYIRQQQGMQKSKFVQGSSQNANASVDKSRILNLTEINEPSECRSLRLPDNMSTMRHTVTNLLLYLCLCGDLGYTVTTCSMDDFFKSIQVDLLSYDDVWHRLKAFGSKMIELIKVLRLTYTNSGSAMLALVADAVYKLWRWHVNEENTSGKATTSDLPRLWKPSSAELMINDISGSNPNVPVSCFALSDNDSYVVSASGGNISLFVMLSSVTMTTFMPPPPAASFLAFHPRDNNIIAIGMDDSSVKIYNMRAVEVKANLKGHRERITGLAFSDVLNVLVSSGADTQLCIWSMDSWEKLKNTRLELPMVGAAKRAGLLSDTCVQFHQDQTHLLTSHKTQIAIYEAPKLDRLKQWVPEEASNPITHATYSCDGQSIYVSFENGSVGCFTASSLQMRCRINPASYLATIPGDKVYPLVIAAHPSEANQFALGLTNGEVYIIEPLESKGKWGT